MKKSEEASRGLNNHRISEEADLKKKTIAQLRNVAKSRLVKLTKSQTRKDTICEVLSRDICPCLSALCFVSKLT